MSTFRNISNGVLYITGYLRQGDGVLGPGSTKYINNGEVFTGSNYYKRFTYAGLIAAGIDATTAASEVILELVTDDGLPFDEHATNVPNNPRVYHEVILSGNTVTLDFETDLGGPAYFMTIESNEDIYCYLDGLSAARIDITAGAQTSFSTGELLIKNVILANTISGAATATVQVIVGNVSE